MAEHRGRTAGRVTVVLALLVVAAAVAWLITLSGLGDLRRATEAAVDAGRAAPRAEPWLPLSTETSLATAPAAAPSAAAPIAGASAPVPDPSWTTTTAAAVGLPSRVLSAYAAADLRVRVEQPGCALSWATLAGIAWVESRHGTIGGNSIGDDGRPASGSILGVPLTGEGPVAEIVDTDGGALDGDSVWDRAVGPLQMLPSTWARWGADADADGTADPQDIDDASLAAGRYLCAAASPLSDPEQWRLAVLAYNRSDEYVLQVVGATNYYAERSSG